jgi:hypothetical protein
MGQMDSEWTSHLKVKGAGRIDFQEADESEMRLARVRVCICLEYCWPPRLAMRNVQFGQISETRLGVPRTVSGTRTRHKKPVVR